MFPGRRKASQLLSAASPPIFLVTHSSSGFGALYHGAGNDLSHDSEAFRCGGRETPRVMGASAKHGITWPKKLVTRLLAGLAATPAIHRYCTKILMRALCEWDPRRFRCRTARHRTGLPGHPPHARQRLPSRCSALRLKPTTIHRFRCSGEDPCRRNAWRRRMPRDRSMEHSRPANQAQETHRALRRRQPAHRPRMRRGRCR